MNLIDTFMGVYFTLVIALALYGLHRYWILYLYYKHYKWAPAQPFPKLTASKLPVVTIQLPIFNERYVVDRLIDEVVSMDYPKDRLEIQVLDDSTDDTQTLVAQKVKQLQKQGVEIVHLHRTNRSGYKAGALAAGLLKARGAFIAIFDADFLPPRDFLKKTLPAFTHSKIGMVQTRWGHLNENYSLLTWAQSIFLDGHFLIEHTARNRSGAFFNFNGTAGIWRREAIETSGGWQHDTLTEDLDLSYRAQMNGWQFVFLPEVVCPAELPVDIHAFKVQQHRWTMGAIQTAKKILPTLWKSSFPLKVKIEATFHLTGCVGYLLMAILAVLMPVSLWLRMQQNWPLTGYIEASAIFATTISVALYYAVCLKELYPDWKLRTRHIPAVFSMGIGMCLSNTKAVLEGVFGKRLEFRRTPKYSVLAKDKSWKKKQNYRKGNAYAGVVEFSFAVYFLLAWVLALMLQNWTALPFLALFFFGFSYIAVQSISHSVTRVSFIPQKFLKPSI